MSRPPDRITDRPPDESGRSPQGEYAEGRPLGRRAAEPDEDRPHDPHGGRSFRLGGERAGWPMWVRLGLWGLPNRASAWAFFWLSAAVAAGSIGYGFVHELFFLGGLMAFAALWYFASIRWVDRHGRWAN